MSLKKIKKDIIIGIKRPIRSRRHNINISPEEFKRFSKVYFKNLDENQNFQIKANKKDFEKIVFILRWYYNLWIQIDNYCIRIFKDFPSVFILKDEINKLNHPHTSEIFIKNTKMYFTSDNYSTCNWMKGIPLWTEKNGIFNQGCQINYEFIEPYFE
mgnify:CR=1 FL=1